MKENTYYVRKRGPPLVLAPRLLIFDQRFRNYQRRIQFNRGSSNILWGLLKPAPPLLPFNTSSRNYCLRVMIFLPLCDEFVYAPPSLIYYFCVVYDFPMIGFHSKPMASSNLTRSSDNQLFFCCLSI